ncbi:unnamed protein product, partial [Arabidopsis halleri]
RERDLGLFSSPGDWWWVEAALGGRRCRFRRRFWIWVRESRTLASPIPCRRAWLTGGVGGVELSSFLPGLWADPVGVGGRD